MGGSGNKSPMAKMPITFMQNDQRIRVTKITADSIKAEFVTPSNRTWREITDEKRLQGIKSRVEKMKRYRNKSTKTLQTELNDLISQSNSTYDAMTKVVASKTGAYVNKISDLDDRITTIRAVLKNREVNNYVR